MNKLLHGYKTLFYALMLSLPIATQAAPTLLEIPDIPLDSGNSLVPPNTLILLATKKNITLPAYNDAYDKAKTYVGYFNSALCYDYAGEDSTEIHFVNTAVHKIKGGPGYGSERKIFLPYTDDRGFFKAVSRIPTAADQCASFLSYYVPSYFSGNFLNWVTTTQLDIVRYSLTGGNRVIDTLDKTVIEGAYIPSGEYNNQPNTPAEDKFTINPFKIIPNWEGRFVVPFNNKEFGNTEVQNAAKELFIINCKDKILFSDHQVDGVNCEQPRATPNQNNKPRLDRSNKYYGAFNKRVLVCDALDTGRPEYCAKYAGNNSKPVGQLQKQSKNMRFGVMSFLPHETKHHYGGVLRAPLKHLGEKIYELPKFEASDNPKKEWDPLTGVFTPNPDGSATGKSGVINFINKMASTGNYRSHDPTSELFYEAIRYYQNKDATAAANVPAVPTEKSDDFPILMSASERGDPVQVGQCQRNNIVTLSHLYTKYDHYLPGNIGGGDGGWDPAREAEPDSTTHPAFDVRTATNKVATFEAFATPQGHTTKNPNPNADMKPGDKSMENYKTGATASPSPYDGKGSYYIVGAANWAYTNDIRKGDKKSRVKSYFIDTDEGGYGETDKVIWSQNYLAAKYSGFNNSSSQGKDTPFFEATGTMTLIHRKWSSWQNEDRTYMPRNYYLASRADMFLTSFENIFNSIKYEGVKPATTGTIINTSNVDKKPYAYRPSFDPQYWSGSLDKIAVTKTEGDIIKVDPLTDPVWDAGQKLTIKNWATRKIYTFNKTAKTTAPFELATLSADERVAFNLASNSTSIPLLGQQRVDYIRGKREYETIANAENAKFRLRTQLLGDIINSAPVYVGAASKTANEDGYKEFFDNHKDRKPVVYVGANDGMLHAFDAEDGEEIFAYIPSPLIKKLPELTKNNYSHKPFMDGNIGVGEAKVNEKWKTVLAAGMGMGAKGLFALDISAPTAIDLNPAISVLFEFTDTDDPDIGFVNAAPQIVKIGKTNISSNTTTYSHYVMVTSGINSANLLGDTFLYLLSLDKPIGEGWVLDSNFYKMKAANTQNDASNILTMPGIVTDVHNAVQYAYSGDLRGNIWRFDFSLNFPSTPKKIFSAAIGNVNQPITAEPVVTYAPGGGYLVSFGTGKYLEETDKQTVGATNEFMQQSFYTIRDDKSSVSSDFPMDRTKLEARTLTKETINNKTGFKVSGAAFIYGTGSASVNKRGWYVDFFNSQNTGERSVSSGAVAFGKIFLNTLIPDISICSAGSSNSYMFDVVSGLSSNTDILTGINSKVGVLGKPIIVVSSTTSDKNAQGGRDVTNNFTLLNFGTGGASGTIEIGENGTETIKAGRISWREVPNYHELRQVSGGGTQ